MDRMMRDIIVESRPRDGGMARPDALCIDCLGRHRIEWCDSFTSVDGGRAINRFRSPDLESLRIVLRSSNLAYDDLWAARNGIDT